MAVPPVQFAAIVPDFVRRMQANTADNADMPTYCYRDTVTGEPVRLTLSIAAKDAMESDDGVVEHEGRRLQRDYALEHGGPSANAQWPILSDAAGVSPDHIPQWQDEMRRRGVALNYAPDGRAIFENPAHRRRCLKALGMHDRLGYT